MDIYNTKKKVGMTTEWWIQKIPTNTKYTSRF